MVFDSATPIIAIIDQSLTGWSRVYQKRLYPLGVEVRSVYTLLSLDPACGILMGRCGGWCCLLLDASSIWEIVYFHTNIVEIMSMLL